METSKNEKKIVVETALPKLQHESDSLLTLVGWHHPVYEIHL